MKRIIVLVAAIALSACQSYETVQRSELHLQEHLKEVEGAVLGVYPPKINYGAIRFTIDLRDATLTVGDQEVSLETRFVEEVDDDKYGRLGILDGDIFSKSGLSEEYLSELASELLIAGIQGETDYNVPYFKGFGTGNMGYLSNRAVSWDTSVYPAKPVFTGEPVPKVFTDVIPLEEGQDPDSAGADYVL
ncbi:MAG: hypothetical protein GWN14_10115, partial [candidate division Zixibacteria bacterium]|nr:hypothetical protein [candidate division Zixibacteria bacterium]NIX56259.1 hypothetical protein [candidate division Zixibacteria bacterium]